jgi:hypothetical protein
MPYFGAGHPGGGRLGTHEMRMTGFGILAKSKLPSSSASYGHGVIAPPSQAATGAGGLGRRRGGGTARSTVAAFGGDRGGRDWRAAAIDGRFALLGGIGGKLTAGD